MRRTFTITATALVSFGLVSCSTGDDAAEQPSPSTVTVTASPTSEEAEQPTEPPAEQTPAPESPATKAPTNTSPETPPPDCGIAPTSSATTDPIDTLAPPSAPHTAWSYEGESNYDPCSDLSYALLVQQPQGNSQFGTQLLFFHQGEYIGIDSTSPQQVMNIEDKGTRLIVTYKDWEALEEAGGSNAEDRKLHRNGDLLLGFRSGPARHHKRIPQPGVLAGIKITASHTSEVWDAD